MKTDVIRTGPGAARTIASLMPIAAVVAAIMLGGCMVGPHYTTPPAPVAPTYRDPGSDAVQRQAAPPELAEWWKVFEDPILNDLVQTAVKQNPTLQSAAVRVLAAQAQRGIAYGLLFPQDQAAFGGYTRNRLSLNRANTLPGVDRNYNDWQLGAAATWELDVWGKYRRGVESANADVLSQLASYDDALVTLISNVATEYISIRILEQRLVVARANVDVQKRGLELADARFKGGTATELDRTQATTLLRNTEALIPELQAAIIQGQNRLCVLLGIPPKDLSEVLGAKSEIPRVPASVPVGIPADLLRRRPDIRRAERELAAQCARIGIAKADLYPSFSLVGDIRVAAEDWGDLFESRSIQAFGGPTFRWALLNYGRIENNVRVEDARFQALVSAYENTVLTAQAEVENGIAGYVGAQRQAILLSDSVAAAERAVQIAEAQYEGGTADYTRVLNTQQALQNEQDLLVSVRGAVALNLVSLYRAMGGGWEIRGNRVQLDENIQAKMRERTDWGSLLPPTTPRADLQGARYDQE
jgi:NodT family efflux transporter outer membrane factor (OMF) lipoprotein